MITSAELTDEMIREDWNRLPRSTLSAPHYYALKRNSRKRAGMQCDDEFSVFCEQAAELVAARINARQAN